VKTTVEIPDSLFRKAKAQAAERGVPLRQFLTEALEDKVSVAASRGQKPWSKMAGRLKHLHKETVRIQKLIDEEFEQIEPEDWE